MERSDRVIDALLISPINLFYYGLKTKINIITKINYLTYFE